MAYVMNQRIRMSERDNAPVYVCICIVGSRTDAGHDHDHDEPCNVSMLNNNEKTPTLVITEYADNPRDIRLTGMIMGKKWFHLD